MKTLSARVTQIVSFTDKSILSAHCLNNPVRTKDNFTIYVFITFIIFLSI